MVSMLLYIYDDVLTIEVILYERGVDIGEFKSVNVTAIIYK